VTQDQVISVLEERGAFIRNTHVVYTSGLHGSAYINKDALYVDPDSVAVLCAQIADEFATEAVEAVAAPAIGGVALSQWTAHHLTRPGHRVLAVFAEKQPEGTFAFRRGYDRLLRNKRTLIVEDILTTGGSLRGVIEAVRSAAGTVVGAAAICNRGHVGASQVGDPPRFYCLADVELESWSAAACPLCEQGVPINLEVGKGRQFLERQKSA
jgi:orotate phosphoribosyltransferase